MRETREFLEGLEPIMMNRSHYNQMLQEHSNMKKSLEDIQKIVNRSIDMLSKDE